MLAKHEPRQIIESPAHTETPIDLGFHTIIGYLGS